MNPETRLEKAEANLEEARKHLNEVERALIEQLVKIKFPPLDDLKEGCKCISVLNTVQWWRERWNDARYQLACAVQSVGDAQ
jgi:hypothetical protein